jgi:CheY-like chemotaxis protein
MNSEIGVKSQPGAGSLFYFSIECDPAEAPAQSAIKAGQGKLKQPYTILVTDDDPNSCNLLSLLLSDFGFNVITARSGNAARKYLGDQIDIVITDQFMPNGDGWSVLQDWDALRIPVMLLSSAPPNPPQEFPESLRFACSSLKPFNTDSLLRAISEVLSIEWISTESESLVPSSKPKRPPIELLVPLKVMIEEGAVTDIMEWLKAITEQHPEYKDYCEIIAASNLELDFESLRNLTGYKSDSSEGEVT